MLETKKETTQTGIEHFSGIVEARINLYHFFSSFYHKPPGRDSLELFLTGIGDGSLADIFHPSCLDKIRRFVENSESPYDTIFQEFHNLFLVPGAQYVTPYESCYREQRIKKGETAKGLLMGKSAREVSRFYCESGLRISEEFRDLPDHIVLELNLMHTLCQRERDQWDGKNFPEARKVLQQEQRFLRDHLTQWVPALCAEISEKTSLPFFHGIAQMTGEFIEMEDATFRSLVL